MAEKTSMNRPWRVGVLVPYTNTNLEPDMARLLPKNCQAHFTRIGGYDQNEIPGFDQMAAMGETNIAEPLRLISGIHPDFVLYGCTSATLAHGRGFDGKLTEVIARKTGANAITAAGAILKSLHSLNAKEIGFASPYVGAVNRRAVRFFAEAGINTIKRAEPSQVLSNHDQGALTPDEIFDLALRADHPHAKAIVMACTDLRAVETISRIESALGKPVVTANQAMVFVFLQQMRIDLRGEFGGTLLAS
jgi:maleate cis-trans isomerase